MSDPKILRSFRIKERVALDLKMKTINCGLEHGKKNVTLGVLLDALDKFNDAAMNSAEISDESRQVLQDIWKISLDKALERWNK